MEDTYDKGIYIQGVNIDDDDIPNITRSFKCSQVLSEVFSKTVTSDLLP
jgi:hypothetical protein